VAYLIFFLALTRPIFFRKVQAGYTTTLGILQGVYFNSHGCNRK